MESDAIVRQLVAEELDSDPSVTAANIGVAVHNGVVTLSGHVPSYSEQFSAVRAAQRVRGVKAIAQELSVRLPQGKKRHDDEIAERAVSILNWTLNGVGDVHVTVDEGWITLSGKVDWAYEKHSAEQAVRRLGGVTGVSNTIEVRPLVDAANVRDGIVRAFERNAHAAGSKIKVSVEGTTVVLSGQARSWAERRVAEQAAWSVAGVTAVRDTISVDENF